MTREAASRHMPYDAFLHTERYPRKASRCISATQYKAGKVVTGDTASCQKPYGTFLQTKCYPRSRNGQSLKMWELPPCFTAISPEIHGHRHSSGGWAKETGWPLEAHGGFSHMEAFDKTQYPRGRHKATGKSKYPRATHLNQLSRGTAKGAIHDAGRIASHPILAWTRPPPLRDTSRLYSAIRGISVTIFLFPYTRWYLSCC